jgi:hypothetical protein
MSIMAEKNFVERRKSKKNTHKKRLFHPDLLLHFLPLYIHTSAYTSPSSLWPAILFIVFLSLS